VNALPRKSPTLVCVPPVACILYELGAGVDFGFAERRIRLYVGTVDPYALVHTPRPFPRP
jgi:hypothetical protein